MAINASRDLVLTHHARRRMQQRAIPPAVVDLLLSFGDCRPARSGAESYSWTKRSWRRLESHLGPLTKAFERYRSTYVVVGDDGIVTAARKH